MAFAAGAVFSVTGCGPSVQFIYEGNIRFEHCYRLDLDEHIAPSHRRACWVEWVDQYSKGQTRDRLEYAKRRIEAFNTGDGAAMSLRLLEPSDGGPPAAAVDPNPVPTSVHAPPPARIQAPSPSSSANPEVPDANAAKTPPEGTELDAGKDSSSPRTANPQGRSGKKSKP
jgi:hypothetical protein